MAATQTAPFTDEQLSTMFKAAAKGATISDIANITPDTLEGIYSLAYNQYTAGNYKDAEVLFRTLCVYRHTEYRFWMGLGGSLQAQEKFREAIDAYSMAGVATALKNPEPFLFGATCYLKMGDRENAVASLKGLLTMGDDSPAQVSCRNRAQMLLHLLESNNK